uniref:Uncharacterized protein At2g29880 family n=1 Tax=Cajanus cajan TaxID=3821 RepID=A0A151R4W4_CAJCA|nr:Uncharacterized protein At2g29880 family [Cajanus cajan]KYP37475.1 Uncharacterized protein At2g29880 family [Cajanus cajan]
MYNHYLSRIKWFKKQYNNMSKLMCNNFGFGWDPITKTLTASDEAWKEHLKSHPSHKNLREESMVDYEDLKIVVGGRTPSGHTFMLIDPNDTDAFKAQVELALACATLHNFLHKECCFDEFSIGAVDEPSSLTLPVIEDHNFESIIQTQKQE